MKSKTFFTEKDIYQIASENNLIIEDATTGLNNEDLPQISLVHKDTDGFPVVVFQSNLDKLGMNDGKYYVVFLETSEISMDINELKDNT